MATFKTQNPSFDKNMIGCLQILIITVNLNFILPLFKKKQKKTEK